LTRTYEALRTHDSGTAGGARSVLRRALVTMWGERECPVSSPQQRALEVGWVTRVVGTGVTPETDS